MPGTPERKNQCDRKSPGLWRSLPPAGAGAFSPAVVLINEKNEWLFAMGPTEKYLRPASGYPTIDLFALVTPSLRNRLKNAIREARSSKKPVSPVRKVLLTPRCRISASRHCRCVHGDEALVLVGFA